MKKRKFIYISILIAFVVCALMYKPTAIYAYTDYDGNGVITQDEMDRYAQGYGFSSNSEMVQAFKDPETIKRVAAEHGQTLGESNGSSASAPAPAQEPPKKEEKHEHKYTAKVTKEATCTEEGEMTYTCDCGDSYTEAIPKKAHEYEVTVTKEPTCSEEGRSVRYCTVCGEPVETMMIDKLPHTEGKWEVVKKPTLTKPGLRVVKCTVCGEVLKEEEIPANTVLLYILIGAGVLIVGAAVSGVLIYKRKR